MKKVQWFLGIVFSLALILVLLINSFQFAAYGDFGFYEKEYKKYGSYKLSFGAFFNGQFYPYPEFEKFSIKKKELIIKNAWEVGVNDIERIVLRPDDEPLIPRDVEYIPFCELFEK